MGAVEMDNDDEEEEKKKKKRLSNPCRRNTNSLLTLMLSWLANMNGADVATILDS